MQPISLSLVYQFRTKCPTRNARFPPNTETIEKITQRKFEKNSYQSTRFGPPLISPVPFLRSEPGRLEDFLDTEFGALYLISNRVADIFRKEGITGWETYPAELKTKRGEVVTGYSGFRVSGLCGPTRHWSRMKVESRPRPQWYSINNFVHEKTVVEDHYVGYPVDLEKWDGSDFFMEPDRFGYFVTQKAADVITRHKITNVRLERLSEQITRIEDVPPADRRL